MNEKIEVGLLRGDGSKVWWCRMRPLLLRLCIKNDSMLRWHSLSLVTLLFRLSTSHFSPYQRVLSACHHVSFQQLSSCLISSITPSHHCVPSTWYSGFLPASCICNLVALSLCLCLGCCFHCHLGSPSPLTPVITVGITLAVWLGRGPPERMAVDLARTWTTHCGCSLQNPYISPSS